MMNAHLRKAVSRAAIVATFCGPLVGASLAQDQRLGDQRIGDAIAIDLTANRDIRSARVSVEVNDGVATLTGAVDTLLARRRAGEIASATTGVAAVVNEIQVRSSNRTDAQIAGEIDRALLDDPATEAFEIEPAVDDGLVTLRGTVESWQERRLAEEVAISVRGVRGVERNNIRVDHARDRSDSEIKTEVAARLANDVRIDDMMIDVTTEDGRVTLSGAVGSDAEARLAEVLARVGGVKDVRNELDVRWWARDRMRRSTPQTPSDEKISRSVRTAFLYDPRVSLFEIEVGVENGVVTLRGDVDNLSAKRMATVLAVRNIGVRRVRNMIDVRPDDVPDDDLLESRARTALMRDAYVDTASMDIRVVNGHAMLDGDVNTMFEKEHAADVVSRVKGIVRIDNGLDTRYDWEWKPDDELVDDVNDQLFWSPFVDSDDVTATARNGVVTLQGVIGSWSERQNAIENAFEGGAKDVIDELEFDIDA